MYIRVVGIYVFSKCKIIKLIILYLEYRKKTKINIYEYA